MKKFISNHNIEFDNIYACALDNQRNVAKFKQLYIFLLDFDKNAIDEWRNKRSFATFELYDIIRMLIFLEILN